MVVCPVCGKNVQARKLLFLTNYNAITCQSCHSKLRIKNRDVSSIIGGVGGGLGGGLGAFFGILSGETRNLAYFWVALALIVAVGMFSSVLAAKYLQLETVALPQASWQATFAAEKL